MDIPKIYLAMDPHPIGGASKYARVTKDFLDYSDGTVAIRHPTKNIFPDALYKQIPEKGFAISREVLKAMTSKDVLSAEIETFLSGTSVERLYLHLLPHYDGQYECPEQIFRLRKLSEVFFHDFDVLFSSFGKLEKISDINLNVEKLALVQKALSPKRSMNFEFYGKGNKVLVRINGSIEFKETLIAINPVIFCSERMKRE